MNRFLSQLGIGIGVLFAWIVLNDTLLQPLAVERSLQHMERIETIILGDSHGRRIWLENSINFASDGAPPFAQLKTFEATRKWLPGLTSVVYGLGPQNFGSLPKNRIQSNYTRYLTGKAKELASTSSLFSPSPSKAFWLHQLIGELYLPKPPEFRIVPFETSFENNLKNDKTINRLSRHDVLHDDWFVNSVASTTALTTLVNGFATDTLCQFLLVGTPLHHNYRSQVGEKGWQDYKEFLLNISRAEKVHYISLEEVVLPDSFYLDADHLNTHGMRWLTDTLVSMMPNWNEKNCQ